MKISELIKPEIVNVLSHIDSLTKCYGCNITIDLEEEGGHIYPDGNTLCPECESEGNK